MGNKRKSQHDSSLHLVEYSNLDIVQTCPILNNLILTEEFNLLDSLRLQVDIEKVLSSITQRMVCLSSEILHAPTPPPILRYLGILEPDNSNRPTSPNKLKSYPHDSLVVTSNPNKPLSLIISSQRRNSADIVAHKSETKSSRCENTTVLPVSPVPEDVSLLDKNAIAAHSLPNRFWSLMEPYCADITESNISYLESILKSYVEEATTSKYFQIPPLNEIPLPQIFPHSSDNCLDRPHVAKRLRRDCSSQRQLEVEPPIASDTDSHLSKSLKAAADMVSFARHVDMQLRDNSFESAQSNLKAALFLLEDDLYTKNVSSVLDDAVAHIGKKEIPKNGLISSFDVNLSTNTCSNTSQVADLTPSNKPDVTVSKITKVTLPIFSEIDLKCIANITTQPLKDIARQLQVSSSFRVDKKVSQAMQELGLFPLTLYLNNMAYDSSVQSLHKQTNNSDVQHKSHENKINTESVCGLNFSRKRSVSCDESSKCPPSSYSDNSSTQQGITKSVAEGWPTLGKPIRDSELLQTPENLVNGHHFCPTRSLRHSRERSNRRHNDMNNVTISKKASPTSSPTVNGFLTSDEENYIKTDDAKHNLKRCLNEEFNDSLKSLDSQKHITADHEYFQTKPLFDVTSSIVKEKGNDDLVSIYKTSCIPSNPETQKELDVTPTRQSARLSLPSASLCDSKVDDHDLEIKKSLADAVNDDDDLSGYLLSLAAAKLVPASSNGSSEIPPISGIPTATSNEFAIALLQRQRELRLVCAANHNMLHRLIKAARRDQNRQEIQRRLAIADADVLEVYNKLENYRVQKKPALKRDRDAAWKILKERQKIIMELETFDLKAPLN